MRAGRRRCLGAAALLPAVALGLPLPDLFEAARPGVVLVGSHSPTDSPRFGFRGSGFAVGDDRLVVTNAHVLSEDARHGLMVQAWNAQGWQARPARLLALARAHDLALLRIEGEPLPALRLAGPELARAGAEVALIGFPIGGLLGFSHVVHRGTLAAVTGLVLPQPQAGALTAAAVRQLREGSFEIYQLDATAYPGNSGGPLLDLGSGAVIGVINMVLTKGARESALSQPTGISYALPVRHVHELLRQAERP